MAGMGVNDYCRDDAGATVGIHWSFLTSKKMSSNKQLKARVLTCDCGRRFQNSG